ncbi:hypothetical protein OIU77_014070 [Salix suchowensis]|uniref:ABC transporter domain-containing protein n=1 Tax=Salix suchowensis TaxID=1278906 RepID=A0ABQ8ZWU3_9ROSI|nr:hypothetical protein OIU77_014070 [Salix suchowensis]
MMPPEQENTNTSTTGNTGPSSIILTNWTETVTVHAEPSVSSSISNMSSCSAQDQGLQGQQEPSLSRSFTILRASLRPVTLMFADVAYSVCLSTKGTGFTSGEPKSARAVLNGVSGVVRPGELLAMLGPSGSGKTTLLTALAGRLPGKISGSITYNGQAFSSSMKRRTGFVTQDDVLYAHLTVLETLTYAALLRLPKKLTREEKIEQAELVIMELGLTRCRNSVVGGPLFRGISGGERKRVSIGQEMLVNPSLLLLDEPTSGLDSTTAQRIVATLRGLARGGRTVITTIHQPSSRLYRMFDKSNGLFWSGLVPDTTRSQDEQLEFQGRLDHHDDQNSAKQSLISSYKSNLYPLLISEIHRNARDPVLPSSSLRGSEVQWTTSWWQQFKVLLRRGLQERKHESYSGLRIFQVMSVSILSGLLWWHSDTSHIQDQVGLLFFFSIFWGFFPLFNAIFAFPQERPMLIKERSSGMYRLSSYYFARMAGDLPMELILPTIFVTVTYWMGGLKPSLITFVLTLLIILFNVLVSQGLGLALGAILMDVKQATTLASVTMLVFLLAGGYYIQHIPPFIAWLKYISFSHYCYKLLVGVQYSATEVFDCGLQMHCRVMDFPAVKYLELDNKLWDAAALTIMFVGYRVLAYVALRMGEPH